MITPVVYVLVLTSIIVHGITIPIGKGFHSVSTRTFTLSRSQTQTQPDNVSRLPAPLPFGSDALREQVTRGLDEDEGDGDRTIRFAGEPGTIGSGNGIENGNGNGKGNGDQRKGIKSIFNPSHSSTPSTADTTAVGAGVDEQRDGNGDGDGVKRWREGNHIVDEGRNGENYRLEGED